MSIFIFLIFAPSSIYGAGLTNGSFESGADDWATNSYSVLFEIDRTTAYEASTSAKITYDGASFRGIEQNIYEVTHGQYYNVSGAIKLDSLSTTAYIRIAWYSSTDATGSQLSTAPYNNNDGIDIGADWSPVYFTVQAPSTAQSAEMRLYVQGGTANFDAIVFEEGVASSETPTAPPPTPTAIGASAPTPTPTPTSMPTVTPSPTTEQPSYSNVYISEAMVAPSSGEYEWVELYNGNDFSVTLTNWYIDDIADGGSSPRIFTATLPAKGYEIVELSSGIFNNSGDSVRLLDNTSTLKHEFSYASSEKGYTWGAKDNTFNFFCIQSPSKGIVNSGCITVSDDSPSPTVAAAAVVSPPPQSVSNKNASNATSISSNSQSHSYYRIVVTPPTMPTQQPTQVHGVTAAYSSNQSSDDAGKLPFLAGTYSLLSGISLGLKVYLKQG